MLAAVKGTIQGNTIVVENEYLRPYDGTEVVVTLLGHPSMKRQKETVEWDSFSIPSERGADVEGYMREMRPSHIDKDVILNRLS